MKKILILTRHAYPNYGSILQAHSLQLFLENNGFEAKILNYQNKPEKSWRQGFSSLKNSKMNQGFIKKAIYLLIQIPNFYIMDKYFSKFRESLLNMTQEYNSIEELEKADLMTDILCTGSDQVWNTINQKLDPVYFWNFIDSRDKKIISYGSSLGTNNVPNPIKEEMKHYLKKFNNISVREKSGYEILKGMGINSETVVDPVMLMTEDYWQKFSNSNIVEKNYILVYQLHDNQLFTKCLNTIKDNNPELRLIRLSPDLKSLKYGKECRVLLHPKEFLSYLKKADFIVTDSFHGTVFSLIFKKRFATILPPKNDARNRDLLKLFNLEDRIINSQDNVGSVNEVIDFNNVSKVMQSLREDSINKLFSMIQE